MQEFGVLFVCHLYNHIVYAVMRCQCGSMHGNALSSDLEPGRSPMQWSGGPTCQQHGNTQLSATATPHHPPSQLQATTCPCHLIRLPSNSARILGMGHMTDLQQIRALLRLTAYYMQQ